MRHLAFIAVSLTWGCVSTAERSDFQPIYGPPESQAESGALTTTAPSPSGPIVERERCPPGDDAARGHPGEMQAEAGIFSTIPGTLGVPQDVGPYSRAGCEPAH